MDSYQCEQENENLFQQLVVYSLRKPGADLTSDQNTGNRPQNRSVIGASPQKKMGQRTDKAGGKNGDATRGHRNPHLQSPFAAHDGDQPSRTTGD